MAILKPDVYGGYETRTGEGEGEGNAILDALKKEGFSGIDCYIEKHLTKEEAGEFYAEHKGKDHFEGNITFMASGMIRVMVLERENAIKHLREFIGATNPLEAKPGTLRSLYGTNLPKNAIHASDSPESFKREHKFFFGADSPAEKVNLKEVVVYKHQFVLANTDNESPLSVKSTKAWNDLSPGWLGYHCKFCGCRTGLTTEELGNVPLKFVACPSSTVRVTEQEMTFRRVNCRKRSIQKKMETQNCMPDKDVDIKKAEEWAKNYLTPHFKKWREEREREDQQMRVMSTVLFVVCFLVFTIVPLIYYLKELWKF